jgi:hypothetical protein
MPYLLSPRSRLGGSGGAAYHGLTPMATCCRPLRGLRRRHSNRRFPGTGYACLLSPRSRLVFLGGPPTMGLRPWLPATARSAGWERRHSNRRFPGTGYACLLSPRSRLHLFWCAPYPGLAPSATCYRPLRGLGTTSFKPSISWYGLCLFAVAAFAASLGLVCRLPWAHAEDGDREL